MPGHGESQPGRAATVTASQIEPIAADPVLGRSSSALARGSCIGRYILLEPIAEGGMGVVFKAYDPELDRRIALKLVRIRSRQAPERERQRIRLLREAQALAQLSHPNVIAVHDVGTFEDDVFIAMELVEGATLKHRLPGLGAGEALELFLAAGRGLAAAHAVGLIHRDFKPDNAMVGDDGRVRVLDFGLARAVGPIEIPTIHPQPGADAFVLTPAPAEGRTEVDDGREPEDRADVCAEADTEEAPSASGETVGGVAATAAPSGPFTTTGDEIARMRLLHMPLTRAGTVLGTPTYMAPEQLGGAPVDERADQFSFCVALCEALGGERPPSEGSALPTWLRQSPAGRRIPARLRRPLARGLSVDPRERYPSMKALLADIAPRPGRQRRWLFAAMALVAALGAVALYMTRSADQVPDPAARASQMCDGAARRLPSVWSPDVGQSIARAFVAAGGPAGREVATRVNGALDAYASSWAAMRVESCRATRVDGEQSEYMLDLRMRCLDRRLDQLGALVRVLGEQPDPAQVDRALQAVRTLPELAGCADRAALTRVVPPPETAQIAAKVAAVRPLVDRAEALERAGRYDVGAERAADAAARAAATGYAPIEAEALYQHGSLLRHIGDGEGAEEALRRGFLRAAEAQDDAMAARLATLLVYVVGAMQPRAEEALSLADFAAAAVRRAGNADVLVGQLENNLGIVLYRLRRYEQAREKFQSALAHWEPARGSDHPDVRKALNNLAAVMGMLGRYAESTEYAERALRSALAIHGQRHPITAQAYHTLGLSSDLAGQYERARVALEEAVEIQEALLGPDNHDVGGYRNSLATVYRSLGRLRDSEREGLRSIAIREKSLGRRHPSVAVSRSNLAGTYEAMGRLDDALRLHRDAYAIGREAQGPEHPAVTEELRFIADILLRQGHEARAWKLLTRVLALDRKLEASPARTLDGMARVRLAQKRYADAARLMTRAVTPDEEAPDNPVERGERLRALGEIYLSWNRPAEARRTFEETVAYWDQQPSKRPTDQAAALTGLGRSHHALRQLGPAREALDKALTLVERDTRPFVEERAEARFALAEILWRTERARAVSLARAAKVELGRGGPAHAARRKVVAAWLKRHRAR